VKSGRVARSAYFAMLIATPLSPICPLTETPISNSAIIEEEGFSIVLLANLVASAVVTEASARTTLRLMGKKAIGRSALVAVLSRAIREGYPSGPERTRWLRWLTRIAAKDAAARHVLDGGHTHRQWRARAGLPRT